MKIYGYEKNVDEGLKEFSEVTIQASPERIRSIARFMLDSADGLERGEYDHCHYSDFMPSGGEDLDVDVIVFKEMV